MEEPFLSVAGILVIRLVQALSAYTPNTAPDGTVNDMAREFIIGVKDVTDGSQLAGAIFDGISAVSNQIEKSFQKIKK